MFSPQRPSHSHARTDGIGSVIGARYAFRLAASYQKREGPGIKGLGQMPIKGQYLKTYTTCMHIRRTLIHSR